jgi:hypothetical protein
VDEVWRIAGYSVGKVQITSRRSSSHPFVNTTPTKRGREGQARQGRPKTGDSGRGRGQDQDERRRERGGRQGPAGPAGGEQPGRRGGQQAGRPGGAPQRGRTHGTHGRRGVRERAGGRRERGRRCSAASLTSLLTCYPKMRVDLPHGSRTCVSSGPSAARPYVRSASGFTRDSTFTNVLGEAPDPFWTLYT